LFVLRLTRYIEATKAKVTKQGIIMSFECWNSMECPDRIIARSFTVWRGLIGL